MIYFLSNLLPVFSSIKAVRNTFSINFCIWERFLEVESFVFQRVLFPTGNADTYFFLILQVL